MAQHIFPFSGELQNNKDNEVAPSSPNFGLSVCEKLSRYGSNGLTDVEHLTLLVGKEAAALGLLEHFGSLQQLSRASLAELQQFVSKAKAATLLAALSVSTRIDCGEGFQGSFDQPETVYRACLDMKLFHQEVLRVILLNARYRRVTSVEISKGTINECVAHPREIFRPAIIYCAYAFVLVHNHPSGHPSPSDADMRLTRRLPEASRILQIPLLDHVIVGAPSNGNKGFFSFREAGLI